MSTSKKPKCTSSVAETTLERAITQHLRPCYTMQVSEIYVSCRRILQCDMDSLAVFFVARSIAQSRTQPYFSQRIAATPNTISQCITPPATFLAFNKGACAHFSFFVPSSSVFNQSGSCLLVTNWLIATS